MSFIPPLMGSTPGKPPHPSTNSRKRSITTRPELIGGLPLYLFTRINKLLPNLNLPTPPSSSATTTPTETSEKTPSQTLHALADHLDTTETALQALQAEVAYLRAQLARRDSSNGGDGAFARRSFTQLCRIQTRYARAERELVAVGRELKQAGKMLRSVEADLVVLWVAFIGLLVAFIGYVAGVRLRG